jgi:hypothetical protein
MLHDGAEDRRLDVLPFAVGLGDGDEIVAEEDAADAIDGEQALGERRAAGLVGGAVLGGPAPRTTRPGRNFRVAGLGVASVWMNIVVAFTRIGAKGK